MKTETSKYLVKKSKEISLVVASEPEKTFCKKFKNI